jgi:transketolase
MTLRQGPLLRDSDFRAARKRLLRMHFESRVGHIGGNLSALDALLIVFNEYLREGDKLVLSKGHSAGALYTALWSIGRLSDDDLKTFHQDNTLLPGHPPAKGIPDIQFATGSLGHGFSLAAGTALAQKMRRANSKTWCLTSDGEWQEGSTWEAMIFASHHRLDNLTILIDHNDLQGFGKTHDVASMSPLWKKLHGFDVEVHVVDGHNADAIRTVLNREARLMKIVILKTIKGNGVSFMQNRMEWHYLPLNEQQYHAAIEELEAQ